jgi:hypothetical protein
MATAPDRADDGRHAFDFFFGSWDQTNRKKVKLVDPSDTEWIEFESRSEVWPILGGLGNVDTFKAPRFPGRPNFEGCSLRLFDPGTGEWRIWWASTAAPGRLDPPTVGRFEKGVGRFECDDVLEGVEVKVRFTWKDITADSAVWEQSFSFDEGESWETNWITRHTRIPAPRAS